MTITLTVALILTLAGFLVLIDRKDKRERDERQTLLQRIQAPHAAVYEHHATVSAPEPVVSPLPMTDEEMAEMQQATTPSESVADIIARMEARENGFYQPEDGILQ